MTSELVRTRTVQASGRRAAAGLRQVARKAGYALIILLGVSVIVHMLFNLVPGGAAYAVLGEEASPEAIAAFNEEHGLNDPSWVRYFTWLGNVLQGDLGVSYRTGRPVSGMIAERIPVTLELAVLTTIVALALSIPVALISVRRPGRFVDRVVTGWGSVTISTPSFLIGLGLVYVFAIVLGALPVLGWVPFSEDPLRNLYFLALPVMTLAAHETAEFIRVLRGDLLTTLSEDFITVAKATGLPPAAVMFRYALRPSTLTIMTLASINFGRLMGGTVIAEAIFSLPGLGSLVVQGISSRDLPVVQGVIILVATVFVIVNLLVDVLYGLVDPRVRG